MFLAVCFPVRSITFALEMLRTTRGQFCCQEDRPLSNASYGAQARFGLAGYTFFPQASA